MEQHPELADLGGPPRRRRRVVVALLAVLATAAAACSDDDGATSAPPAPTATTTPAVGVVDWSRVEAQDLGDGWELGPGVGDAPYAQVLRAGEPVGIVELSAFPVDSLDAVVEHLDDGEAAALEAHADEFAAAIGADRSVGCGPGYRFEPAPAELIEVGDGAAIRYGFSAGFAGEATTERTLQWAALRGDHLVLVNVAAYEPTGCVGTDGAEFLLADLAEVEERLGSTIEASDFSTIVDAVAPEA